MSDLREQILEEVADREGTDVSELPTLYESIEVDGLKSIATHARESEDASVTVRFDYAGYRIVVDGTGTVSVRE